MNAKLDPGVKLNLHTVLETTPGTELQITSLGKTEYKLSGAETSAAADNDFVYLEARKVLFITSSNLGAWCWSDEGGLINVEEVV